MRNSQTFQASVARLTPPKRTALIGAMEALVIRREREANDTAPSVSDVLALFDQAENLGERDAALSILQSRVKLSRREIFSAPLEHAFELLTEGELASVFYLLSATFRRVAA